MNGDVQLAVEHETLYRYGSAVESAQHLAFLRPRDDERQRVEHFELAIDPAPAFQASALDVYGNTRTVFGIASVHRALRVATTSRVRVAPGDGDAWLADSWPWEQVAERLRYRAGAPYDAANEFAQPSPFVPRLDVLRRGPFGTPLAGQPVALWAKELMHRIHEALQYDPDSTSIDTPLADVLAARRGVCQDFAHLAIANLRALGLAARYVSGYLLTRGGAGDGEPAFVGADASHAWLAVWCPLADGSARWLELDPTNDVLPDQAHVRLAVGRDFGDVTPLRGIIRGGGAHTLEVRVRTTRVA
jgi:transglutaminase-like putative cysteine protease